MRKAEILSIFIIYLIILLLWQFILPLLDIPSYILPTPKEIFNELRLNFVQNNLHYDLMITLSETLSGLLIAIVFGILFSGLISEFRYFRLSVYPLLVILQSMPKMALAPLILIWVGLGISSKIVLAALVAFFPILINCISGFQSYDSSYNDLFEVLKISRWHKFTKLKLHAFLPSFLASLKVGYVFALLGAIVGEFLGSTSGLGHAIIQMQFQLNVAGVFAILVVLGAIGYVGERIITLAEARALHWRGFS